MKKVLTIGLAMVVAVGLLAGCGGGETATYNDGTYTAVSDAPETDRYPSGFDGSLELTLTIADDVVTDVSIVEYDGHGDVKDYDTYGQEGLFDGSNLEAAHNALAEAIIEANDWDVDAYSGATGTSDKVREAAQRAFEKALVDKADGEYFDGTFMGLTDVDERGSRLIAWVTIEDDAIVDVVFAETYDSESGFKDESYGSEQAGFTIENLEEAYAALAAAMVEANSADVEAFSGATGTSEKAVEAVQDALDVAKR